jgi:nitrogen regulatory protein PII
LFPSPVGDVIAPRAAPLYRQHRDGKIFVTAVENVVRVRTGESGTTRCTCEEA